MILGPDNGLSFLNGKFFFLKILGVIYVSVSSKHYLNMTIYKCVGKELYIDINEKHVKVVNH